MLATLFFALSQAVAPWVAEGWKLEVVEESVDAPREPICDELGRSLSTFIMDEPWNTCFQPSDLWAIVKAPSVPWRYVENSAWTRSDKYLGFGGYADEMIYLEPGGRYPALALGSICTLPALNENQLRGLAARPAVGRIEALTFETLESGALKLVETEPLLVLTDPQSIVLKGLRKHSENAYLFDDAKSGRRYRLTDLEPAKAETPVTLEARRIARVSAAGEFDEEELEKGLSSDSPLLRAAALRAFEPRLTTASGPIQARILSQLRLDEPIFARQVACSFGLLVEKDRGLQALVAALRAAPGDRSVVDAVRTGIYGRELEFLRLLSVQTEWRGDSLPHREALKSIALDVVASGRRNEVLALIGLALAERTPAPQAETIADAVNARRPRTAADSADSVLIARRKRYALGSEVRRRRFDHGERTYLASCVECHLPSGIGESDEIPSLRTRAFRTNEFVYLPHERKPSSESLFQGGLSYVLKNPHACTGLNERQWEPEQLDDLRFYLDEEWLPSYR